MIMEGGHLCWAQDSKPTKIKDQFEVIQEKVKKDVEDYQVETVIRPTFKYSAQNLRDPFKEPQQEDTQQLQEVQLPEMKVQGVIWGTKIPQAIINNTVVKPGDVVFGGVKILEIKPEGIVVFFKNRNYNLSSPVFEQLQKTQKKGGVDES